MEARLLLYREIDRLRAINGELLEACKALHAILMQTGFALQGDAIAALKKSAAAIEKAGG
jgi:hypothetical protein